MQKSYKYVNGEFIETQENALIGWEYNNSTFRIICEACNILFHAQYGEMKYVIENYVSQIDEWIRVSTPIAIISTGTYCYANGQYEPVPFEEVDDLDNPKADENGDIILNEYNKKTQLKAGLITEWDFFFNLYMNNPTPPPLSVYVKAGAEIKTGVSL